MFETSGEETPVPKQATPDPPEPSKPSLWRRVVWVLLAAIVLTALVAGGTTYYLYEQLHLPFKGYTDDETFIEVERGQSAYAIATALENKGIIERARLLVWALRLRDDSGRLQAGEYRFSEPLSTLDVVSRLVEGDVYTFSVTVPEGLTVSETAAHLETQGAGDRTSLEEAFAEPGLVPSLAPPGATLEGYLFPTTYHFPRNPSPRLVARTMVDQLTKIFDGEKREKAEALGLTPHEVLTLASVVEKETGSGEERPLIASVFWNRLQRGMPLASDPTIIYALKIAGVYDGNLKRVHLELDSPYNTYRVPGIPPGPIASPGEASIDAVLDPPETPFLFFVSKNDGTSHFSRTFREHAAAVQKYQVEYFRNRRRKNGEGSP